MSSRAAALVSCLSLDARARAFRSLNLKKKRDCSHSNPPAMFTAPRLVRPSKRLKEIDQIDHFICLRIKKIVFHIKDFAHFSFVLKQSLATTWNWPINVTRLTIPTGWRQTSWILTTVIEDLNKSSQRLGRVLNPGSSDCKSNALTTRPRCLLPLKP